MPFAPLLTCEAIGRRSASNGHFQMTGERFTNVVKPTAGGYAVATLASTFSLKERRPDLFSGTPRAHAIDRWIFVFMAAWFIAIVLAGFIPDALMKIGMVEAGQRPPFPLIMHLHAVAMGSFLLLLLAQAGLMATGRSELHMRVGIAAFALVPILVVVGFILAPTMYHQLWNMAQSGPPSQQQRLQETLRVMDDILLLQIRAGILFALFMTIGLRARKAHSGLHKRMMFLAPAVALGAAIDRMTWLPTTLPASAVASDMYILAALSPMFVWDVIRNKRVHEAYLVWIAICLPVTLVLYSLWDTPWWHGTARLIMAVR